LLGGADDAHAALFADFGRSLGIGFQVRDDLLGIWGATATTGKAEADDIRRRKQSLPIVMLRGRAGAEDTAVLDRLYHAPEIAESGIQEVLALLERHAVREAVEARITELHHEAAQALAAAANDGVNPARDALASMVSMLADREH
jgi:geranylgeranyl diphosphate synthase type I